MQTLELQWRKIRESVIRPARVYGGRSTEFEGKKIRSERLKLDHSSQNEPALDQARTGTLHQQQHARSRTSLRDANNSLQVSWIFRRKTQKFWSALYTDSHLIACEHVWCPDCGYIFHLQHLCEKRSIIVSGMFRRASRAHVDKYQSASVTARTILMFISMFDLGGWPPFFKLSSPSFRFFKNIKCHLCIVASAIHSDPYAFLNNNSGAKWYRYYWYCIDAFWYHWVSVPYLGIDT